MWSHEIRASDGVVQQQHYLACQLFAQFNEATLVAREKPTVAAPALPLTLPTPSEIRLRTLLHLTIAHSREPTVVVPAVDHIQQMAHHEQARNVIFAYGGVGTMWRVIAKSGAEEATIMSVLAVLLELTEEKGMTWWRDRDCMHDNVADCIYTSKWHTQSTSRA